MRSRRTGLWILLLIVAGGVVPWALMSLGGMPMALPGSLPQRSLPLGQQAAQALAGLVVKPTYMLVSGLIILALLGQPARDLRALLWGQIAFLAGEILCAVNFYVFEHASVLSEYLHSYGMALAFGFTAFAIVEALDGRLLRLTQSQGACAALNVCGRCTRHETAGCRARSVALCVLPAVGALAALPLFAAVQPDAYRVSIFGFPYSYARLEPYEFYERRLLPLTALLAMVVAIGLLLARREPPVASSVKIMAAIGTGALGFSLFRVTLSSIFANSLVWFEFWEEATEFLFIGATAVILWEMREALLASTAALGAFGIRNPRRAGRGDLRA